MNESVLKNPLGLFSFLFSFVLFQWRKISFQTFE